MVDEGSNSSILNAVLDFAWGYHSCLDTNLPPISITLVPSITNDNLDSGAALTSDHANEWSQMVQNVYSFVVENGWSEIDVAAGISAHPSWSTYSAADTWVQAYSDSLGSPVIYNFGSTDGYPAVPAGESEPVVPPPWDYSNWTIEQLYNLSWGIAGTQALPQIFHPQWARGWYAVKKWSIDSAPSVMTFAGQMSECQASPCAYGEQPGVYFTQDQAKQVLLQELNLDPDESVHQNLDQSTDVQCSNGVNSESCQP